jgi:amino acid transporter
MVNMYSKATLASSGAGTAGTILPFTNSNLLAMIVAGLVLLFAALALTKLVPKLGRES